MSQTERILGPGDVADLFGVDPSTVVRWADEGILPFFRTPGGHRRFRSEDVERLRAGGSEPTEAAS